MSKQRTKRAAAQKRHDSEIDSGLLASQNPATEDSRSYWQQWSDAWNRFWFTPADPALLGLLRILVGGMLFYTHLVWSLELTTFFGNGSESLLPSGYRGSSEQASFLWSHFDWIGSEFLWPVHIAGLIVFAMFTLGLFTRVTGILSALLLISYANRSFGTQFGLDQINGFMAFYLAVGPSGQFMSLDRWRLGRRQKSQAVKSSTLANVSIRLMQVHLCVVYLFAGMGKLQGDMWWNGQAIWGAVANYEYQTIDLTWLSEHMWLVNLVTYSALIWEVTYPFLIWPKLTRPIFITMAILVHLGIGLSMGMLTFGLIMVFANLSFLNPSSPRNWLEKILPVPVSTNQSDAS